MNHEMRIPLTASPEEEAAKMEEVRKDKALARECASTRIRLREALALADKLQRLLDAATAGGAR